MVYILITLTFETRNHVYLNYPQLFSKSTSKEGKRKKTTLIKIIKDESLVHVGLGA